MVARMSKFFIELLLCLSDPQNNLDNAIKLFSNLYLAKFKILQ